MVLTVFHFNIITGEFSYGWGSQSGENTKEFCLSPSKNYTLNVKDNRH